ncbi:hypothetical protein FQN57_005308 [Myotisia sp. PD_48]|nr:hypothetical protein FQN57_005308 [Myotisia sp. PD_48]
MGWFWGSSGEDNDPTKKLDPTLRQFLEQESPAKYTPTTAVPPPEQRPSHQETPQKSVQDPTSENDPNTKPSVPAASLFQDGRYAHLWKDYQPLEQLEGSSLAPGQKVVDQYKRRKDVLNRAALENCSGEHEALTLCYQTGTFSDKMKARLTMCRAENQQFSRCYVMQSQEAASTTVLTTSGQKFLQALGYGAAFEWDAAREERIQMHADLLYHRMLDHEAKVAEAKAEGREPPPAESLFKPQQRTEPTVDAGNFPSSNPSEVGLEIPGGGKLPPGVRPSKPLKEMTPHERELEIESLRQQMVQKEVYFKEVSGILKSDESARDKRREKLSSWFGETVGKWLA